MKKTLWMALVLIGLPVLAAAADEPKAASDLDAISAPKAPAEEAPAPHHLKLFSVSSDELDPRESLDRVSGHIDLGFSGPSQSFNSIDHYTPGPFSREKAAESIS